MNNRGFTLIELMTVAAIIAMIVSVILSSLGTAKSKGRDTERVQEMKNLQTTLELYQLETGYPQPAGGIAKINSDGNSEGATNLTTALQGIVSSSYLAEIPRPPKGSSIPGEFYYYQTADNGTGYRCGGKFLGNGGAPYFLYFSTELPQKLTPLTDSLGTPITPNVYCFAL